VTHTRRLLGACLLLSVSVWGIAQGTRAGLSQVLYASAKYGAACRRDSAAALRRCEQAYQFYPHSYFLCEFAAERAYADRAAGDTSWTGIVERWCDRGLAANPHARRIRELAARALSVESPQAAVEYWQRYVDWDFWRPDCHAVMLELRLKAGDFSGAMESLRWLEGSPYHDWGRRRIRRAWTLEGKPPDAGREPVM
jgi:hypothetical protein